jgi:NAD(P)-dependent dehydrogenase (short-subunit alcohol dehydrogenase family)
VATAAIDGGVVADVYAPAYRIAKTGLLMLTKSLAKELAHASVNVNMVSPGYMENAVDLPDKLSLPMHRAASFEEVSRTVVFLLADESKYITGQNIEVCGGVRL